MSDISRMLAETASRIIAQAGQNAHAQLEESPLLHDVQASGLHLSLAPEEAGGAGLTAAEAAETVRVWGRHAAPLPIVELLIAARLAVLFGDELTSGIVACSDGLVLSADGDGCKLAGCFIEAPSVPGCKYVYACATSSAGACFIVSISTEKAERFFNLAGESWLRLDPEKAHDLRASPVDGVYLEGVRREGALLTAAAMNGAMAEVLALLIDYVNTRSQFGRPIGRFQAVQHLIADIAGELLASEAVLSDALHKPDDRLAWLSAKIQAGRAATAVAAAGHQLFGAIGFTAEHVLHRYTKRLWAWRDEWGRQGACERNVGEMAMMSGESGLWSFLVDRPEGIAGHG